MKSHTGAQEVLFVTCTYSMCSEMQSNILQKLRFFFLWSVFPTADFHAYCHYAEYGCRANEMQLASRSAEGQLFFLHGVHYINRVPSVFTDMLQIMTIN